MSNVVCDSLFNLLEKSVSHFSQNRNDPSSDVILQNLIKIKENASYIRIVADNIA